MQLIKTLSVLALATGAVVAMPAHVQKRQWRGTNRWWTRPSPDAEVTVTGYAPQPTDWDTDAPTSTVAAVPTTTAVVVETTPTPDSNWNQGGNWNQPAPAASTPTEAPAAAPTSDSWSAPAPSSAPSTGGSGGQDNYMSIVSKWRAAGGLSALTQDSTLEANALKTADDSGGQLKHELNPGTFAQVLAPGDDSNFESVYVGGWLCEIPSLPGLDGICSTMAQGWDHSDGELGHAQILTSGSYSKIGCALAEGIWACDLA